MWILGIETSCDETAAALFNAPAPSFTEKVARQFATHAPYRGVVPELASRCHLETISRLVHAACADAGIGPADIGLVAATSGPGLAGALIVGLSYAKALALALNRPFVAVNHIEAHMYAAAAETDIPFPFLALVVSGGHTLLADIHDVSSFDILGRTRDDAAGEAFDKGAAVLGLGFPGGQALEEAAKGGNPKAVPFPRGMAGDAPDFSFSGLKTALLYFMQRTPNAPLADVAASYQEAIVDVLVRKTIAAATRRGRSSIVVGGGVAANGRLRALLQAHGKHGFRIVFPSVALCTDNARMIAHRGLALFDARGASPLDADIFPALNFRYKDGIS